MVEETVAVAAAVVDGCPMTQSLRFFMMPSSNRLTKSSCAAIKASFFVSGARGVHHVKKSTSFP
jgi:hypothetical protein